MLYSVAQCETLVFFSESQSELYSLLCISVLNIVLLGILVESTCNCFSVSRSEVLFLLSFQFKILFYFVSQPEVYILIYNLSVAYLFGVLYYSVSRCIVLFYWVSKSKGLFLPSTSLLVIFFLLRYLSIEFYYCLIKLVFEYNCFNPYLNMKCFYSELCWDFF